MKIALLYSGHMRSSFYLPEIEGEHEIDIFVSTWDDNGLVHPYDSKSFLGESKRDLIRDRCISFEVEKANRDFFLKRYGTDQWQKYYTLSSPTTSGDAVSMWYKVNKAFQLCIDHSIIYDKNYDLVIKYRPDVVCHQPITKKQLQEAIKKDTILMPRWHGKYESVTCQLMDQFFFGSFETMSEVCTLFNQIDCYLEDKSIPHCGEGLLSKALKGKNLVRFDTSYDLQRKDGREKVL